MLQRSSASATATQLRRRGLRVEFPRDTRLLQRGTAARAASASNGYLMLWAIEDLAEHNREYEVARSPPGSCSSRRTAAATCTRSTRARDPHPIVEVWAVPLELEEAERVASDLADFVEFMDKDDELSTPLRAWGCPQRRRQSPASARRRAARRASPSPSRRSPLALQLELELVAGLAVVDERAQLVGRARSARRPRRRSRRRPRGRRPRPGCPRAPPRCGRRPSVSVIVTPRYACSTSPVRISSSATSRIVFEGTA